MEALEAALRLIALGIVSFLWGRYHDRIGLLVYSKRRWRNAYIQVCELGTEMKCLTLALTALVCAATWFGITQFLTGTVKDPILHTLLFVLYWAASFLLVLNADELFWEKLEKQNEIDSRTGK